MREFKYAKDYKKGRSRLKQRGANMELLNTAEYMLTNELPIDPSYNDHQLKGKLKIYREMHIGGRKSDWVLVYSVSNDNREVLFKDTGTHRDVYGIE